MNIALLPSTFTNQRAEATHITLILMAKQLKKLGHKVYIISDGRKDLPSKEVVEGINVYRGPALKPAILNKIISPIIKLKQLKKKEIEFDVIHSFSAAKFIVVKAFIAKLLIGKVKVVHTLRSYSRSRIGNSFNWILNLADYITVPTKIFAEKVGKKAKVIRSLIDLDKYKPKDKESSRKKLGIKDKFIIYYGGSRENKGIKILIDAFKILNPVGIKLMIIFREPVPKVYQDYVSNKGIKNKCILIGKKLDNVQDYVMAAEIVVLPYINLISTEGNPSCIIEAMASKTPVVTTNLPELKEIVIDGEDVIMAEPGSVNSLAKKIGLVLTDKNLQKKLVINGFKISKEFDAEKVVNQFLKLYSKKGL
jgi:glycosyltransferase involved in cell wall biosynthesis